MKKKKAIDSIDNLFDEDPTDELPVLNEAALARIESVEASAIGDSDEDTGEHAQLRMESVAVSSRDWAFADQSNNLERLEDELKSLQKRWHHIEDELRDRDAEVAGLENELRARAAAIEALETELQSANQSRLELEEAGEALREAEASQHELISEQQRDLDERKQELDGLRAELEQARAKIAELDGLRAQQQEREVEIQAETERLADLEQQLSKSQVRVQDLETHLEGRRARWRAMQATCKEQAQLLATLEKSARAKEKQFARQDREIQRLADQLRQAERRSTEFQLQAEAAGQNTEALRAELQAGEVRLASLSDALKATRTDGESLVASIADKAARVEDLQQQLTVVNSDLKAARRSMAETEALALAKDETLGEERARAAELTGQLESLEEELTAARQELSDRSRKLAELDSSAAELASALQAADDELRGMREDRDKLITELESRDSEIESLNQQVTQLEEERATADAEIKLQQARISDLEAELQNKTESLSNMGRDIERINHLETRMRELDAMMSRSLDTETNRPEPKREITRVMVATGGERAVKYPLYKTTMTIGRSSDSDIQIRKQYISRHHAKLCTEKGDTFIEDLGSKNGVLVNASPVTRHRLQNGDVVDLGQMQFKFIDLLTHDGSEGNA